MSLLSARRLMEKIGSGARILADGGIGSELLRFGIPPQDVLRANLGLPEVVQGIHSRYLSAGAEILTCNTFGLRDGDEWAPAVRAGAHIALQAARHSEREVGVWAALPGSLLPRELETLRFAASNRESWPTILLIETCTSLDQAISSARAACAVGAELLMVTGHFKADGRMPDGILPEQLALRLLAEGVHVVGANCGDEPESFIEITRRMRAVTNAPLLIQPSAGLPVQDSALQWRYPIAPEPFASIALRLFAAGANIVGGCCGTSPAHIAAICARLDSMRGH
jgi:methionine synthase I (cobalamin-dependent)